MKYNTLLLLTAFGLNVACILSSNGGTLTSDPAYDQDKNIVVEKDGTVTFTAIADSGSATIEIRADNDDATVSGDTITVGDGCVGKKTIVTVTVNHTDVDDEGNPVTCTHDQDFVYNVYVPKIVSNETNSTEKKLYYFKNPDHPFPANIEKAKYKLEGVPDSATPSYDWTTDPEERMEFSENTAGGSSGNRSVIAQMKKASEEEDDTDIVVKIGDREVATKSVSIRTAHEANVTGSPGSAYFDYYIRYGWVHDVGWEILDQLGGDFEDGIGATETFFDDEAESTYTGQDWSTSSAQTASGATQGTYLNDHYGVGTWTLTPLTPTPLSYDAEGGDTEVYTEPQDYSFGSQTNGEGVVVKPEGEDHTHTLHWLRGDIGLDWPQS